MTQGLQVCFSKSVELLQQLAAPAPANLPLAVSSEATRVPHLGAAVPLLFCRAASIHQTHWSQTRPLHPTSDFSAVTELSGLREGSPVAVREGTDHGSWAGKQRGGHGKTKSPLLALQQLRSVARWCFHADSEFAELQPNEGLST